MRNKHRDFSIAVCLLAAFVLWTVAVRIMDVQAIGPLESTVGFAALNRFVHECTGVHMHLYTITDWLGLVPLCFIVGFAVLGLQQWLQRKSILKVDFSILVLGGFYLVVMGVYILFEKFIVNYRPVLINGFLEASYPSSTTLLVMCVMPTTSMQLNLRIKCKPLRKCASFAILLYTGFMVIGRLISGVHWFSDIIGGILLSAALVMMYRTICGFERKNNP